MRVGACLALDHTAELPQTGVLTSPPPLQYSPLPPTMRLATGLPRFSTQSQSPSFPSCSSMAHLIDACPLSRDAMAYCLLKCPPGRHCVPLCYRTSEQLAICTSFVPLPCESGQHNHSKTATSAAAYLLPLLLFVRARTNPSKLSAMIPGSSVVGRSFPASVFRACY